MNQLTASLNGKEVDQLFGGLFRSAFPHRWASSTHHLAIHSILNNECDRVIELRPHFKNGSRN